MSFIKKGLKKAWEFVKKYWKEIVMVAAVVFTAGIATVGFAGFATAMAGAGGGVTGFFSAVGSTMWAGVTATAGSMGIGSGANIGAGSAFAGAASTAPGSALAAAQAAGVSNLGLGAAMGVGPGGYGLGAAGELGASQAAAAKTAEATAMSGAAVEVPGVVTTAPGTAPADTVGKSMAESLTTGHTPVKKSAETLAAQRATADAAGKAVTEAGMSTAEALMWSTGISTVGAGISGYAQGKALEEKGPMSAWGVPLRADKKGSKGYDYEANLPDWLRTPSAPTPDAAAGALMASAEADALAGSQAPIGGAQPSMIGGYRGTRAEAERKNRLMG